MLPLGARLTLRTTEFHDLKASFLPGRIADSPVLNTKLVNTWVGLHLPHASMSSLIREAEPMEELLGDYSPN